VAIVQPLLRNPAARRDRKAFSEGPTSPHTYELRPTSDGWLVLIDERLLAHCATLPQANLALIQAHARHTSASID
jgi:hypothetical protein